MLTAVSFLPIESTAFQTTLQISFAEARAISSAGLAAHASTALTGGRELCGPPYQLKALAIGYISSVAISSAVVVTVWLNPTRQTFGGFFFFSRLEWSCVSDRDRDVSGGKELHT